MNRQWTKKARTMPSSSPRQARIKPASTMRQACVKSASTPHWTGKNWLVIDLEVTQNWRRTGGVIDFLAGCYPFSAILQYTFRYIHASLYEGLSFGPLVRRSVRGSPVFLDRNSDKSDRILQIWRISLQFYLSPLLQTHLCSNEFVFLQNRSQFASFYSSTLAKCRSWFYDEEQGKIWNSAELPTHGNVIEWTINRLCIQEAMERLNKSVDSPPSRSSIFQFELPAISILRWFTKYPLVTNAKRRQRYW